MFVSLIDNDQLLKFAPGSSEYGVLAEVPDWGGSATDFLGLAVDDVGHVYGASESGVWKFDCRTGEPTVFEGTEDIGFPNALAFDDQGNLYLSDSWSNGDRDIPFGAIWRIGADVAGSAVKRVDADGTIEVLAEGAAAGLDLNTSVAFGIGGTELTLYTVNLANIPDFSTCAGPALGAIGVDTAGQLPPR